jgi:predicted DNA repair protein MutK
MPAVAWFAKALACGIAGLALGFVIDKLVKLVKPVKK